MIFMNWPITILLVFIIILLLNYDFDNCIKKVKYIKYFILNIIIFFYYYNLFLMSYN